MKHSNIGSWQDSYPWNFLRAPGVCRYMEAAFLHRALPAIMIDFFQPRQIMNVLMDQLTSFSATDAKSPLMLASVVDLTFRYLQHKGHQAALVEWVVMSCSTYVTASCH